MVHSKVGFHCGVTGVHDGLGAVLRSLDAERIPAFVKSADDAGKVLIVQDLWKNSGVPHIGVYRKTGVGTFDVPNYNLSPRDAAIAHWKMHMDVFPPELDKNFVWLETVNEVNKDLHSWVAEFCFHTAGFALRDGHRWLAPGWSSGEPEDYQWETPEMLSYLSLVAQHPSQLGIALHEYSYRSDRLIIQENTDGDTYPWLLGRFQELLQTCADYGIQKPTIMITECGWTYNDMPSKDVAMAQLSELLPLYAQFDIPAALWALGPNSGAVNQKMNNILFPVYDYIVDHEFELAGLPTPEPPVNPPGPVPVDPPVGPRVPYIVLNSDRTWYPCRSL